MRWFSLTRRKRFVALLLFTVLVVGLVIQAIRVGGGKAALVAPPNPLVGTWLGPDSILDLRPDGTARSRSIKQTTKAVQYFEWSVADGSLAVMMAAQPQERLRRLRQSIFGATTIHYEIVTVSTTDLQLLDKETGEIWSFTSTADPTPEAAP